MCGGTVGAELEIVEELIPVVAEELDIIDLLQINWFWVGCSIFKKEALQLLQKFQSWDVSLVSKSCYLVAKSQLLT